MRNAVVFLFVCNNIRTPTPIPITSSKEDRHMTNNKLCLHCGKMLINKRVDAKYCNAAHRVARWRLNQERTVSIKLSVPNAQFIKWKAEADVSGLLINAFLLSKVTHNTQGATA